MESGHVCRPPKPIMLCIACISGEDQPMFSNIFFRRPQQQFVVAGIEGERSSANKQMGDAPLTY